MTDGRLPFAGVGRRSLAALVAAVMTLVVLPLSGARAEDRLNMTVLTGTTNVDVAISWSKQAYTAASDAVIGRDNLSPDNLASGVLQGLLAAPLLLNPSNALDAAVKAELDRLGVRTVHILGGTSAISSSVESALRAEGYSVRRYSGASRIETGLEVAKQFGASATTALLSRAYGTSSDETATWADALAGGAWSAGTGFPVLFSETTRLTTSTEDYIKGSRLTKVIILGGTAAISATAETQLRSLGLTVERVSSTDRYGTAVEINKKRGYNSAADAPTIVLADGQASNAWAAGFAAAGYASNKPLVLSNAGSLPSATDTWFSGGTASKNLVVAPYVDSGASSAAADKLDLLKRATPTLDSSSVPNNSNITGKIAPVEDVKSATISGVCVASGPLTLNATTGAWSMPVADNFQPNTCELTFVTTYKNDATQTDKLTVTIAAPGPSATVLDAPELTNVTVANTTTDHVLLKYTFDEPVTLVGSAPFNKFKIYGFSSASFTPEAPVGTAVRQDPNDTKSILASFLKLKYERSTAAGVDADAVKDLQELKNPEGSRGIQTISMAAGQTTLPTMTGVTLSAKNTAPTGAPEVWVVAATFTFNRPATMSTIGNYKLIKSNGTDVVSGASIESGDETASHVIHFTMADKATAEGWVSGARRAWLDADSVPGPTTVSAVTDSEGRRNISHSLPLNGGAMDSGKVYLTSVAVNAAAGTVTYTFNANATLNATTPENHFFIYRHDGTITRPTSVAGTGTTTITATYGAPIALDSQTTGAGYLAAGVTNSGGFETRAATNGARTYSSGISVAPDLQRVTRKASAEDPFGGSTPTEFEVTFHFDEEIASAAILKTKLWAYRPNGIDKVDLDNANSDITCERGTDKKTVVCTVPEIGASTNAVSEFAVVRDAAIFAVETGAVKTSAIAKDYFNYPSAKIPSAS